MSAQHSIYEYDAADWTQYRIDAKELTRRLSERAKAGWDLLYIDGAMYIFRRQR